MKYFFLFVFVCLSFGARAEEEKITFQKLIDQFNAVVFIHEHGKTGREAKPLVKWTSPIVFSPAGTLTVAQRDHLFGVVNRIRLLTGLDIKLPKQGEPANLIVFMKPNEEMKDKLPPGVNCLGNLGANKNYEITQGKAFVPSDRPDKTDHCLVEETVQLFGVLNDSDIIKDSIFNEKSDRTSLSLTDQIILKALYDPRLKTGMTRDEVQPVLKQVMTDILKNASKRKQ